MSTLTLAALQATMDQFRVTYIVKNKSSRDKLKAHLKATGVDPLHRIVIDAAACKTLKGGEIGYRLECPAVIFKDNHGRIVP